jgi:hypothetical protein
VHRRNVLGAGLAATALAGLAWLGAALAGDPAPAPPGPPAPPAGSVAAAVAAGRHVRIDGPRGPIHVWIPAGYRADTGATILYVHGYWDSADTAWTSHRLPEQFALAALNALYIVPEAPIQQRTPINYPVVGEILRLVEDQTGVPRGAALTAAVGHSGAYRTIQEWLDEPLIDQIIMIDAMYGDEPPFVGWYNASPRRRLINVGWDTLLGTESISAKIPETVTIDRFPPSWDAWPAEVRRARSLYIRSQYMHMPLVTDGVALPFLLRLLPVELLGDLPWRRPLGSMPPLPDAAVADAASAPPD